VAVGQRVSALTVDAFADYAVADAGFLASIPEDADAGEASMMSLTAPLARRVLESGRIPAGGTVLIQSAAGTIGHLATQLAHFYDPKTIIGTASSAKKLDFIRDLGAEPVDLSDPDWPAKVRAIARTASTRSSTRSAAQSSTKARTGEALGTMVSYGAITTEVPAVPVLGLQLRTLTGVSLYGGNRPAPTRPARTSPRSSAAGRPASSARSCTPPTH